MPLNITSKELFRKVSILAYYKNVSFIWLLFALLPSGEFELDKIEEVLLFLDMLNFLSPCDKLDP